VDIGCGMNAVRLSLKADQLPDDLRKLRLAIEAAVPVGFAMHTKIKAKKSTLNAIDAGLERIICTHPGIQKMQSRKPYIWAKQLGTLGGGNHFIELCIDENDDVWIMLHSGSRGIGNVIGRYFINLAKKEMRVHRVNLPDADLSYLKEGTSSFDDYVFAVNWAQEYAILNRREMMRLILDVLKDYLPAFHMTKEAINCHHNYLAQEWHFGKEVFVTRKGAIRAGVDELGIIPGSMGARSYIVRGKGVDSAFHSCAHGAGRIMSRSKAKRLFKRSDIEEQTRGIECRKDKGVVDEIPAAYKDIDEVMNHQHDLVDIVHTLKQLICIKG